MPWIQVFATLACENIRSVLALRRLGDVFAGYLFPYVIRGIWRNAAFMIVGGCYGSNMFLGSEYSFITGA